MGTLSHTRLSDFYLYLSQEIKNIQNFSKDVGRSLVYEL